MQAKKRLSTAAAMKSALGNPIYVRINPSISRTAPVRPVKVTSKKERPSVKDLELRHLKIQWFFFGAIVGLVLFAGILWFWAVPTVSTAVATAQAALA